MNLIKQALLGIFLLISLQIYGQAAKESGGPEKVFYADFSDVDKGRWPFKNSQYYFFLVQNGTYRMETKAADKKAYLLPQGCPSLDNYKLEAKVTLDKGKAYTGSAGLAANVQNGLHGGYLFEINRNRSYRIIRMAEDGAHNILTPLGKTNGWVSEKGIAKAGKENILTLSQENGVLRFSINGKQVYRTATQGALLGMAGLYADAYAGAWADDFALYRLAGSKEVKQTVDTTQSEFLNEDPLGPNADLNKLTDAYLASRRRANELESLNGNYKTEILALKRRQEELERYIRDNLDSKLRSDLEKANKEADILRKDMAALRQENAELKEFKRNIQSSKEGDQVILYAERYKAEQRKTEDLQRKNEALQKEIDKLKEENKILKANQKPKRNR